MAPIGIQPFFNQLNKDTMHLVDEFYDSKIHFCDPLNELHGVDAMRAYYANLYKNVVSIRFEFTGEVGNASERVALWTMHLVTKSLNGGKPIIVPGNSHIKFGSNGKAIYHRDYFDMGAFIYEHIPVLGTTVRFIKSKLMQH